MQKSSLYRRNRSWRRTDSSAKSATKVFRGTRICSFTGEATTFHGNYGREQAKRSGRRYTYARKNPASTTIRQEPWETSPELRSISAENTARKSGSARNVPRNMQFSQIGKLIVKSAAPESTNVTVEPSSQGTLILFSLFRMFKILGFYIIRAS